MKKILFIMLLSVVIFSCKKKINNHSSSLTTCEQNILDNTISFDFAPHDSMVWYAENGWNVNNAEVPLENGVIYSIKMNPNNPYEMIYEITTNDQINQQLFKYNFCTNTRTLLLPLSYHKFDWTKKNRVYFFRGPDLFRMDSNATNEQHVYTASTITRWIESSPNGELLSIERTELGLRVFTIITEDGEEISNLEGNGFFLGWFDNEHVLIQYDGEIRKANVYTEEEEFYLAETYNYYDPKTEQFLKQKIINGFESWQTLDKNGVLLNETEAHIQSGFLLSKPRFVDNNRIISVYLSRQRKPGAPTMFLKQKAIIMNLDGSNARRVTAFEE